MARLIREAAGVSQVRLARELGVHRISVVRWEAGLRVPRGELRRRYVTLLNALREDMQ
jgi:DNA-binding transcriptional regulator YiaG